MNDGGLRIMWGDRFDLDATMRDASTGEVHSPCGGYLYVRWRRWKDEGKPVCWIGLHPLAARHDRLDPAVRRMVRFSRALGFPGMLVVNLYAMLAASPVTVFQDPHPVGIVNDSIIADAVAASGLVIGAWGTAKAGDRVAAVMRLLKERPVYCLGTGEGGGPKHPLYVSEARVRQGRPGMEVWKWSPQAAGGRQ